MTLLDALAHLRPPPASPEDAPAVPTYLMLTDDQGRSTLRTALLGGLERRSVSGGAAPQWLRDLPGEVCGLKLAALPVGWVGEWHESPQPQWVVPLSGRWFLETADGHRAEMGPGDIHFGQDQGTVGERGHRSGQLGDEPCVQLIVQFREPLDLGEVLGR